jgi:NitT/TauT family transport system permease protein
MAGGWFFLMTVEALNLEGTNYRLPGIGSYMQVAVDKGDAPAMLAAIVAMVLMIVALDQFLWRPVVVWAQKFRVEEGGQGQAETSWFLTWLRRSRLVDALVGLFHGWSVRSAQAAPLKAEAPPSAPPSVLTGLLTVLIYLAILVAFFYGAWQFVLLLLEESVSGWGQIGWYALLTLARVLLAVALGTLWALPAGLAIGLSPRLSRVLQPVVQVVASFPAPMLFPLVIWMLNGLGVTLGWGSVVLMLLGTQWYILFNIIAGAMSIPADLKEAARSYRIGGWQRFWHLYFPAVFPYLVTGWVTAAGGAWNASIVAEFVTYRGEELVAPGLGAHIRWAADGKHFPELAASVLVMSSMVVLFNRIVWRRCYELAESKFSLNK